MACFKTGRGKESVEKILSHGCSVVKKSGFSSEMKWLFKCYFTKTLSPPYDLFFGYEHQRWDVPLPSKNAFHICFHFMGFNLSDWLLRKY